MLESNHSFFIIKYKPCSNLQLRLYHPTKLNIEFIMNDKQGKIKKKKKKKKVISPANIISRSLK